MKIDKHRRNPQRRRPGSTLTTHVLDTSLGLPAAGIGVALYALENAGRATVGKRDGKRAERRTLVARAVTNDDGRTDAPLATDLRAGTYELVFSVAAYFKAHAATSFYDQIPLRFKISDRGGKYHVPLLVSPWGYSTYRGS